VAAFATRKPVPAGAYPAGVDAEALVRLKRRAGFIEAARSSARSMAELYQAKLLNVVLNDRGRFMIFSLAVHLHFLSRRDPNVKLTAARLRLMAVEQGASSPGRAAAVIALMQWGGYLVPAPAPAGDRSERLVVTGRLTGHLMQRWRMQLSIMAPLFPEASEALERLDDPAFVAAFGLAQGQEFVSGFRFLDHAPELAGFFERNCGLMILLSLAGQGSGDRRITPEVVNISISALARRFGVSRPHVIALFRDAEAQGLLRRSGDEIRIGDALEAALGHFYALVYLVNLVSIRNALADIGADAD
jgi:hypothetical protein